jgi:hypothetical protein
VRSTCASVLDRNSTFWPACSVCNHSFSSSHLPVGQGCEMMAKLVSAALHRERLRSKGLGDQGCFAADKKDRVSKRVRGNGSGRKDLPMLTFCTYKLAGQTSINSSTHKSGVEMKPKSCNRARGEVGAHWVVSTANILKRNVHTWRRLGG